MNSYVSSIKSADELTELFAEIDNTKDNNIDEKLNKINKINQFQLEELLNKKIDDINYAKLVAQDFRIEKTYTRLCISLLDKWFSNYNKNTFNKTIQKILINTNWKIDTKKTTEKL